MLQLGERARTNITIMMGIVGLLNALATFQWHISYIIYRLYIRDSDEIFVVENSFFDLEWFGRLAFLHPVCIQCAARTFIQVKLSGTSCWHHVQHVFWMPLQHSNGIYAGGASSDRRINPAASCIYKRKKKEKEEEEDNEFWEDGIAGQ